MFWIEILLAVFFVLSKAAIYACALLLVGLSLYDILKIGRLTTKVGLWLLAALLLAIGGHWICLNAGMGEHPFDIESLGWLWPVYDVWTAGLLGGAVVLLMASRTAGLLRSNLMIASAIVIAIGLSNIGHSRSEGVAEFAPVILAAHVWVAAFWVAAVPTLWPRDANTAAIRTERFSRYALALVPVVFMTGLGLVWLILERPWLTLSTPYERLMVLKLAGVVGILGLGALNKTYVARKLKQDPQTGSKWLRQTLAADATLFFPPPSAHSR